MCAARLDTIAPHPAAGVVEPERRDHGLRRLGHVDDLGDAGAGDDEVHGGSGDDRIRGGDDNDLLYAGRGSESVYGDGGDDVVVILGRCELELGEVYDGGAGSDTLISPFTPAQLATLGITVSNFETILTTHPDAGTSVCSASANTFLADAD